MSYMKKPAITICDENLLSRKFLCESKPGTCTDMEKDSVCVLYAPYCIDPNDMYLSIPGDPLKSYPEEYYDINFTKASGFEIEKNLLQCEWFSKEPSEDSSTESPSSSCGKPEFVRAITTDKLPAACYTLKPSMDLADEKLHRDSVLRLILRWHASDLIAPMALVLTANEVPRSRAYRITFHYPGHTTNPFVEGFQIQERRTYKVQVTQLNHIRMPPPYSTNCHDYMKEWMENGRKGPIGRQDCQAYCEIDTQFKEFGCVPTDVDYPHDRKLCTGYKSFDQDLNSKIQKCIGDCRDACSDTEFITNSEIAGEISVDSGLEKYNTPCVAILEVYFDSLKSKTIISKPKYESVELFSYIGGYLGMWLGWSLISMFDFLEILFYICRYPFSTKKKRNEKAERSMIQ